MSSRPPEEPLTYATPPERRRTLRYILMEGAPFTWLIGLLLLGAAGSAVYDYWSHRGGRAGYVGWVSNDAMHVFLWAALALGMFNLPMLWIRGFCEKRRMPLWTWVVTALGIFTLPAGFACALLYLRW